MYSNFFNIIMNAYHSYAKNCGPLLNLSIKPSSSINISSHDGTATTHHLYNVPGDRNCFLRVSSVSLSAMWLWPDLRSASMNTEKALGPRRIRSLRNRPFWSFVVVFFPCKITIYKRYYAHINLIALGTSLTSWSIYGCCNKRWRTVSIKVLYIIMAIYNNSAHSVIQWSLSP